VDIGSKGHRNDSILTQCCRPSNEVVRARNQQSPSRVRWIRGRRQEVRLLSRFLVKLQAHLLEGCRCNNNEGYYTTDPDEG
jgi:hypothetical protein